MEASTRLGRHGPKRLSDEDTKGNKMFKLTHLRVQEQPNDSPCEIFIKMAFNIISVWEIIMNQLSARDVAHCLKVNKSLRSAIIQCLENSTKLCHKMDVAATTMALRKRIIQSKNEVHFKGEIGFTGCAFALDDTWYYKRPETASINLVKVNSRSGELTSSSCEAAKWGTNISVYPTMNESRVFYHVGDKNFIPVGSARENVHLNHVPCGRSPHEPHLLCYRLLIEVKQWPILTVTMNLVNANGEFDRCVQLYDICGDSQIWIRHIQSNEECKMLMILPGWMALHDATDGKLLWKIPFEGEIINTSSLFLTKDIAGYIHSSGCTRILQPEFRMFDTKNGQLIANVPLGFVSRLIKLRARGSYLCCSVGMGIHVIRVLDKQVKKYDFAFPLKHFTMSGQLWTMDDPSMYCIGFLGKSNILLGTLDDEWGCSSALFALDLDAAMAAENDEQIKLAFSLPLASGDPGSSSESCWYKPVYRTDRRRGTVDIVGIMRDKRPLTLPGETRLSWESYNFITEMQYTDHF